jgi:ubiquinone/menaquinone biosynthesis C-methylase UbiE
MSTITTARYDGLADWYDDYNAAGAGNNRADLQRLLGPGSGRCLDLGCGTGHYVEAIRATGRTVIGLDRSADQLRLARRHAATLVRGDAAALPFADRSFPTVVAMWISTDVDDMVAVLGEITRVLTPGGLLVCFGAHPCFNNPSTEYRDGGAVTLHPTYRQAGWHHDAPWWGHNIRRRVGMRHVPLGDLLTGFAAAGLHIEEVVEPGRRPIPIALAIRARRVR